MQQSTFIARCTALAVLFSVPLAASGLAAPAPLMTLTRCEDVGDYRVAIRLKAEARMTVIESEIDFARSTEGPVFREVRRKPLEWGEGYEFTTKIPETMPFVQICADPGGNRKKCWEPMWSEEDDADGFPVTYAGLSGFTLAADLKKDWISGWLGRYQWKDQTGRQYAVTLRREYCKPGAWVEAADEAFLATFQGDQNRVDVYRVDVNNGHKPTEKLFTLKREGDTLTTAWAGMRPAGAKHSGNFFAPAR